MKSLTQNVPTAGVAQAVDQLVDTFISQRRTFERKWYDNNFFDDGYHFRYLSRTTGKIVDLSNRQDLNLPERAIPKASRQLRGIANLLVNGNHRPVVYPEKLAFVNYQNNPAEYEQAKQVAKDIAQKQGSWIEEEWKRQELKEKLTQMVILAGKHGVSYLELWPEKDGKKIKSQVFDAFDIYLHGTLTSIYDSPAIIKGFPEFLQDMISNELFDEEQRQKLLPDNKYSSSKIKEAYMKARYGTGYKSDKNATTILYESFIKEWLTDENWEEIVRTAGDSGALEGKSRGDMVMRHTYSAGGTWLLDEYVDLDEYPFVDFRFEPGQIYQVPLIERFIPANKSLDIGMSRIERYMNTMVTGVYQKRKGENYQITNMPGGQLIEYDIAPLQQMNMAPIPQYAFEYLQMLNRIIEEQGASTSALGQLPSGVKSGIAIESVKQIEYANLKINSDMLKNTVSRIAYKMLEIADKNYIDPQEVAILKKGEPTYFNVMGQSAIEKRQQLGLSVPADVVPLKKDCLVTIETESDLGYTMEGKKEAMQQIITFVTQLAQQGYLTQEAVSVMVNKFLETFQFGATQEFTDAMNNGMYSAPLTDKQLTQMKIAMAEVMKDMGVVGQPKDEQDIMKAKIGSMEAMKDAGLADKQGKPKEVSKSISFKDLPPDGKAQLAAQAGISLDPNRLAVEETMKEVKNDAPSN